MAEHMRTHQNTKQPKNRSNNRNIKGKIDWTICDKTFSRIDLYNKHMRDVHNKKEKQLALVGQAQTLCTIFQRLEATLNLMHSRNTQKTLKEIIADYATRYGQSIT